MAAISAYTLSEAQEMLTLWKDCEKSLASGQVTSYRVGTRECTIEGRHPGRLLRDARRDRRSREESDHSGSGVYDELHDTDIRAARDIGRER